LRAVDPTSNLIQDQAAAFRAADEELCRALRELQRILDRHDISDAEPASDELYREWLLSLNVIRDALQAVERIAGLLTMAAEDRLTDRPPSRA
jgi:hypothetical protein